VKKLSESLARILTYALSPSILVVIFIMAIALTMLEVSWRAVGWGLVGSFLLVGIPTFYVLWRYITGRSRDLLLRRREDRAIPLLMALVCGLIGFVLIQRKGAPYLLELLAGFLLVNLSAVALITFFWKISLHTATAGGLVTLLLFAFGWKVVWVYLGVVASGWARVRLKEHSAAQVVMGALLAIFLTAGLLFLCDYKIGQLI